MVSTAATSNASASASSATSMLSMLGGALKKINGVKDLNKLSSHCHVKEKDPVPEYQPTPIHVLKAKSLGRGVEYDPVYNYNASSSRVTLPSSAKRSHSGDAVTAAKRLKVVADDDKIEAKFSDSDDDRTVDRTVVHVTGSTTHVVDNRVSAKGSETHSLPSLSTKERTANVQKTINNSQSKTTNLPTSASAAELAAKQHKRKDSAVNHPSALVSQTNFTVNSVCSGSSQLRSAVSTQDDSLAKQQSSKSKAVVHSEVKHTDEEHSRKLHHQNTSNRNTGNEGSRTLKTKNQHNSRSDSHHSTAQSSSDRHKHGRSSSETKSGHINSSKNVCQKNEVTSEMHKHSSDKHSRSEKSDKKVAASSSHSSGQKEGNKEKEKHVPETSAHKHRTTSTERQVDKVTLQPDKKHKTSSHIENKSRKTIDVATGHRRRSDDHNCTESVQSKTATDSRPSVSGKDSKSSHHKYRKHNESSDASSSQHRQPVTSSQLESHRLKTATSNGGMAADTKYMNTMRNIQLFGEDSDTESELLTSSSDPAKTQVKQRETIGNIQSATRRDSWSNESALRKSSDPAKIPTEQRETLISISSSRLYSQSSDEVILLSTDDLSAESDNDDDTFEQCHRLYLELARQQQSKPATCTSSSIHSVS